MRCQFAITLSAFAFLASTFLSGCTQTVKLYSGRELPSRKVVTLKVHRPRDFFQHSTTHVALNVDEQLVSWEVLDMWSYLAATQCVQILPGLHKIEWAWASSTTNCSYYEIGTIDTKAGEEYDIYFDYLPSKQISYERGATYEKTTYAVDSWTTWIENNHTGQVVVGNKPTWADHNYGP